MKKGKIAFLVSQQQLKTLLYCIHHELPPNDYLDDEDRELVELLEQLNQEHSSSNDEIDFNLHGIAIDDLPF